MRLTKQQLGYYHGADLAVTLQLGSIPRNVSPLRQQRTLSCGHRKPTRGVSQSQAPVSIVAALVVSIAMSVVLTL